jgi:hypothetical protein
MGYIESQLLPFDRQSYGTTVPALHGDYPGCREDLPLLQPGCFRRTG